MKKTNTRTRLSIKAESIRTLTDAQLARAAGGQPNTNGPSHCLSCGCATPDCSQFPCLTHYAGTCETGCL